MGIQSRGFERGEGVVLVGRSARRVVRTLKDTWVLTPIIHDIESEKANGRVAGICRRVGRLGQIGSDLHVLG